MRAGKNSCASSLFVCACTDGIASCTDMHRPNMAAEKDDTEKHEFKKGIEMLQCSGHSKDSPFTQRDAVLL